MPFPSVAKIMPAMSLLYRMILRLDQTSMTLILNRSSPSPSMGLIHTLQPPGKKKWQQGSTPIRVKCFWHDMHWWEWHHVNISGPREEWDAPLNKFAKMSGLKRRRNTKTTTVGTLEAFTPAQSYISETESRGLISQVPNTWHPNYTTSLTFCPIDATCCSNAQWKW